MFERVTVPQELIDEARSVNDLVEQMLAAAPSSHTVPPQQSRQARLDGNGWMGPLTFSDRAGDRTIEGPGGPLRLRTFTPESPAAVYLHIHGGGWVLGGAEQQDLLLEGLSDAAGVAVVSVDYRLAPEHPFPAGPDDCEAAALWVIANAADQWGTDRIIIGGESAGAHLAALTLLRLRDRHGASDAISAANLVFGAYDLSRTPSQRNWGERNLVLSGPIMEWFVELFTPGRSDENRRDPAISPLYADLGGLPPALFTVGTMDPLIDDTLFMAARWQTAGNEAEVAIYPESIHGFHAFPTGIGRLSIQQQVDFVTRHATAGR